jgi:hypothetical protein
VLAVSASYSGKIAPPGMPTRISMPRRSSSRTTNVAPLIGAGSAASCAGVTCGAYPRASATTWQPSSPCTLARSGE